MSRRRGRSAPRVVSVACAMLLLGFGPRTLEGQTEASDVSLSPGDVLEVEIWREEDLSGEFQVNEEGYVVLPLLGERAVTGRPWQDVRGGLLEAYSALLRNPSITLTPLRRVFILGEVNEPGLYSLDPTISLAGAVAMAGGANSEGDLRRLRVVRDGATLLENLPVVSPLASVGVRSGDQIFVERRGWLERNSTFVVTAALSVTSIVVSLLR